MTMKGIILAAGKGTRLLPLTETIPKVMLDVGGKPVIEHIIDLMKSYGIIDIAITTHHLGHIIHDHFRDGKNLGVNIIYTMEKELCGNAGGIRSLRNFIDGAFLVIYGDNLVDVDLKKMLKFHKKSRSIATIGVYHEKDRPETKGIIETDSEGNIISFIEKPKTPRSDLASAAVYILEPKVFDYIHEGFSDFGKDVFPEMMKNGEKMRAFEVKSLIDIGTFETLEKARKTFR